MIGRRRGPKWKLRAGYRALSWNQSAICRQSYCCPMDIVDSNARHIFHRRVWYRAFSLCYAYTQSSGIILIT